MTFFDESLHPRGQAVNAGQFASKSNAAPTGELTASTRTLAGALDQLRAALAAHEQGAVEYKTDIDDDPLVAEVRAVLAAADAEKGKFAVPAAVADAIARDFTVDEPLVFVPADGHSGGFFDVLAYDGAEGRAVKYTLEVGTDELDSYEV